MASVVEIYVSSSQMWFFKATFGQAIKKKTQLYVRDKKTCNTLYSVDQYSRCVETLSLDYVLQFQVEDTTHSSAFELLLFDCLQFQP